MEFSINLSSTVSWKQIVKKSTIPILLHKRMWDKLNIEG